MQLVFEDKQKRTIKEREEVGFSSFSSFHLVVVTARAKSEKQISEDATDDEELIVKIDGEDFPKVGSKGALLGSPAAFNGGQIHNLSKTVFFLTHLEGEKHTITLKTDEPHHTATLESIEVFALDLGESLELKIDNQAEDGDRRPWITFALVDLPLALFRLTAITKKRYRDSDDLKIIIDGQTKTHFEPEDESPSHPKPIEWFYRFWYFAGSILLGEITSYSFKTNLPKGLHYIELWADRMPKVESVEFEFGEIPAPPPKEKTQKYKGDKFGRDYNQLDQYILDAVAFWNGFFLKQEYPPTELLDPNLVKAVVYRESRLGYYPNKDIIDVMQVWNEEDPAKPALLGEKPESEFVSRNDIAFIHSTYPKDKAPPKVESREESIFWGVRWLYHKAQYLPSLEKPYIRKWLGWREAVWNYNANPEIVKKYVEEVFSVYEKGVDLEGNVLWEE